MFCRRHDFSNSLNDSLTEKSIKYKIVASKSGFWACARSSIGQSDGLRSRRLEVQILSGAPAFTELFSPSLLSLKTPESSDYKIDSQKEAISVGQVVKLPQLKSWKNFLELFLFEKKAEGKASRTIHNYKFHVSSFFKRFVLRKRAQSLHPQVFLR